MAYTFKYGDRPIEGVTIQRAVGRGGFGEVYYAVTDSGKQIALKFLRDNPDVELRGIAHVMNLKSPHLISIFDVRRNEHGDPFVLMEYVSGPSLRDLLIAEPDGLGPQKAAFFLSGVAKGLSYLHERGIVHRDMKPGNIFYDDGYVKIGDYGLSKHIAVSKHSGQTVSVGTVHYMAPEIGSGSYTKAIDIYALGVILYEMLTGRLPFTGASMAEVLMRHLRDNPDTSGVPEPFQAVIVRAMAKDPRARYQDVNEMVDAITAVHEISEGIRLFDASALNAVQREAHLRGDDERTRTSTPALSRPVELDARAVGGLPPIPPIPDVLRTPVPERPMSRRERKRRERAQRRAVPSTGASPGAQFLTMLLVLFGVAGVFGVLEGDGAAFGASLLLLGGATIGALVAHAVVIRRAPREDTYVDRIVRAVTVGLFAMPGFAAAANGSLPGSGLPRIIIPLAGAFLVFDWRQRFFAGARQEVDGGKAFLHALFGMFVAALANAGGAAFAAGVMCAANLVLVQLAAAWKPRWVLPAHSAAAPPGLPLVPPAADPRSEPRRWERAFDQFGRSVERVGQSVERAVNQALGSIPDRFALRGGREERGWHMETTTGGGPDGGVPPIPPVSQPTAQTGLTGQPSFVGRTANAGLAFLGKVLLLLGLMGAFLYQAPVRFEADGHAVVIENGVIFSGEIGNRVLTRQGQVSAAVLLAPVAIGGLMLVVARRRAGMAHLVRGIAGGALALVATLMMLGPGGRALRALTDDQTLWPPNYPHLPQFAALLALVGLPALVLLFWPRRRGQKTIVI